MNDIATAQCYAVCSTLMNDLWFLCAANAVGVVTRKAAVIVMKLRPTLSSSIGQSFHFCYYKLSKATDCRWAEVGCFPGSSPSVSSAGSSSTRRPEQTATAPADWHGNQQTGSCSSPVCCVWAHHGQRVNVGWAAAGGGGRSINWRGWPWRGQITINNDPEILNNWRRLDTGDHCVCYTLQQVTR